MLLMVIKMCLPLFLQWQKAEKIAIFDIAKERAREMFILNIFRPRIILLTNVVPIMTQVKVMIIISLILSLM